MIKDENLIELPVTVQHGEAVQGFPLHHGDPFDRMLLAQARVEGLVLVTSDKTQTRYGVQILII